MIDWILQNLLITTLIAFIAYCFFLIFVFCISFSVKTKSDRTKDHDNFL